MRGEFGAIDTTLPGVQFSEVLPLTARMAHKVAVVRSMSHENANHVQASLPAQTGHKHPPSLESRGDFPPSETDFPPIGAVLDAIGTMTLDLIAQEPDRHEHYRKTGFAVFWDGISA